jgi:hypothetical protein
VVSVPVWVLVQLTNTLVSYGCTHSGTEEWHTICSERPVGTAGSMRTRVAGVGAVRVASGQ